MKKISIKDIKVYLQEKLLKKVDKKIIIYLIFVAFSTVFWFLNKLNNEFNASLDYPVKYVNFPTNKVLVSELPNKLKLQVSAFGHSLLKYKINPDPFPVVINLNDYEKEISPAEVKTFDIQTRQIKADINQQLGKDITLHDVLPDKITFVFDNIVSRKIAVSAFVETQFDLQCLADGPITFSPDSIMVHGPKNILDTMRFVYTKNQSFKRLNKTIERNVSIRSYDNLDIDKKRVVMKLPVAKYTEAVIEIAIKTKNVPDSLNIITFPKKAQVNYMVSLNNYDKISENDFVLEVDYNDIEKLLGDKLNIKLVHATNKVKNPSITPENVEYIIERAND